MEIPGHFSAAINTYTYVLNNFSAATQALSQGQTADEVFTYTIKDVFGATHSSTLTITVTGTNDRPVITHLATDAQGSITEQRVTPAVPTIVTGTLSATDVDSDDDDADLRWEITDGDGTYGSITIDPETGEWTYTLDGSREATIELNGDVPGLETFTARVTDSHGAYRDVTITVTVEGINDLPTGEDQNILVTEDVPVSGNVQGFVVDNGDDVPPDVVPPFVSDVDDVLVLTSFSVDTNGDGEDEDFAPGDVATIKDAAENTLGTITFDATGGYTFTPALHYSGNIPPISYTMTEDRTDGDGQSITQILNFTITPVADTPVLELDKDLSTLEDTAIALGLDAPVISDAGTNASDVSERLGVITLTVSGEGAAGVTLLNGTDVLTPFGALPSDDKVFTIVLTDGKHVADMPDADPDSGIYHMTAAQYEALSAVPGPESGKNFTVTISVTSYEVNSDSEIVVPLGATSTQVIDVDVQAVTDQAILTIAPGNETIVIDEGTVDLDIGSRLISTVSGANIGPDADGSEQYVYEVSGLPIGTIVTINGTATEITETVTTVSSEVSRDSAEVPTILITPPEYFSGEIKGVTITLKSQDTDEDSEHEVAATSSTVSFDIAVEPKAGDLQAGDVTVVEDTPAQFLSKFIVLDKDSSTGVGTGAELITSVSFDVPAGWTYGEDEVTLTDGWTSSITGSTRTITFDDTLTQTDREAILHAVTLTPPAHSSEDGTVTVTVKMTDTATIDGTKHTSTATVVQNVVITVTPSAERVGPTADEAKMNISHAYTVPGREDEWFALGTNYTNAANSGGGFAGLATWSNPDADEFTYAVLTPSLSDASAGDSVNGTTFRFSTDGGITWVNSEFKGTAIWVPAAYLSTLQVKLPADVAGTLTIAVRAATVDYDDDNEYDGTAPVPLNPPRSSNDNVNVKLSGSATLTTIVFEPVADDVTMALNGRAAGLEDTDIPLLIKTTSTDRSETFELTIEDIPVGATISYGSETPFVATTGNTSFVIEGFKNTVPLSIRPPENSNLTLPGNGDFTLKVSAKSIDGSASLDVPISRNIIVSVKGVADVPVVELGTVTYEINESDLDLAGNQILLSNMVTSVTSEDTDGSESLTLRITGLAEGLTLTGATAVSSGTGVDRVWVVSADKIGDVKINLPKNYSGGVEFTVAGVTTENDGDSRTGSPQLVQFVIVPSPEATITDSATLLEDVPTSLNLAIVHNGGDTDEVLGRVFILANYDRSNYTILLSGTELSEAGLTLVERNGEDYYEIPANQVANLQGLTAANRDGNLDIDVPNQGLKPLQFLYEVIDVPTTNFADLSQGIGEPVETVTVEYEGSLHLNATPVTDTVTTSIASIDVGGLGSVGTVPNTDGEPEALVTTNGTGAFTVRVSTESTDTDGSEKLVRLMIEGVPDGVTVNGASNLGGGKWLFVYKDGDALEIGESGQTVPVTFTIGGGAITGNSPIKITSFVQDQGQLSDSPALVQRDSVSWTLDLTLNGGQPFTPPVINQWDYIPDTDRIEDTPFALSDIIAAQVSTFDATPHSYSILITGLPAGTVVTNMVETVVKEVAIVDGVSVEIDVPIWTATVVDPSGENGQSLLDALMQGIIIPPPLHLNQFNGTFTFDAKLSVAPVGGQSVSEEITPIIPLAPKTDPLVIEVTADNVPELASSVTANITVRQGFDGMYGTIVGGKIYVKIDAPDNNGGTVTLNGQSVGVTSVSGVEGVDPGDYYVVPLPNEGGTFDLTYTAAEGTVLQPGQVVFTVTAVSLEENAVEPVTTSVSGTAEVLLVNNGVDFTSRLQPNGVEAPASDKGQASKLNIAPLALKDNDGSETVKAIMISGVPVGFLIYTGADANSATLAGQASNAGGDQNSNTWVLSTNGTMPAYVSILPAKNWSGTVTGMKLIVVSGETDLTTSLVETFDVGSLTVLGLVDGITINPTRSFGNEGQIIDLNLNAAMLDAVPATAGAPDESIETTSLMITGLGEYAAFYVGGRLLQNVTYDLTEDAYTLTNLSQDMLDQLGVVQAKVAITDQDPNQAGVQVMVTAWTVEASTNSQSAPVSAPMTLAVTSVTPTNGNDSLLWNGLAINGGNGTDSVALRHGEDVTSENLANLLKNIEVISLNAEGANAITGGLSIADVLKITGSETGTLTIFGDREDSVELSSDTEWSTNGVVSAGTVAYISTAGSTVLIDEDIYNNQGVSFAA